MNAAVNTDYPSLLGTPEKKSIGDIFDLETHHLVVASSTCPLAPGLGKIVSRTPGNYANHCPGFARAFSLYADKLGNRSVLVRKHEPLGTL